MSRLDKEREQRLQPKRVEYAKDKIKELGFEITFESSTRIEFVFKGSVVRVYPYSGWHTGASIKDGRGIENLLEQIKNID